MNVAIYARVSTEQQAEKGYSISTQIEACQKKAMELGADTVKVYKDDGYSGAYLERPALDSLRDALAAGLHDVVIVYDTDRLARDTMILLLITEEIEKHARLVFVNAEYSRTPEGQLFYEIRGSFAKYERLKIQDRMARGRRGKLKAGKPLKEYKIYGYDYVNGQYVINDAEADLVKEIYRLYLENTGGFHSIPEALYKKGIVSLSGKKFHPSTIHKILTHQHYTGTYFSYRTYNKKTGANSHTILKRDTSEWIQMHCPRIIPQDTWEAVQSKLARNRAERIRENKYNALFQGVLYCEACGHKMRLTRYKTAMYYACGQNRDTPGSCDSKMIRAEVLDALLWRTICDICKSEATMKKYLKRNAQPPKKTENIEERLEAIAKKRTAIMGWYSNNLISMEQCTQKLEELKRQENALRQRAMPADDKPVDITAAVRSVKVLDADYNTKRTIVTKIVAKAYVKKEGNSRKNYSLNFNIIFA